MEGRHLEDALPPQLVGSDLQAVAHPPGGRILDDPLAWEREFGWMRNNGFEWLFRLVTEPKRLWRRYLVDNLLFVYYIGIESFLKALTVRKIKPAHRQKL